MPRFEVRRSIEIDASPEQVFQTVCDFRTWPTWSPWLCIEPDAKVEFSADTTSVGSVYTWDGDLVGEGEIEHRLLQPSRLIEEEIRIKKPFSSTSKITFEFASSGAGVKVTWSMYGALPWFLSWMKSMMETLVGMDYERGLKMLKESIETGQVLSTTSIRGIESVGPLRMAGVRKTCATVDMGPSMKAAFEESREKLCQAGLPTDGLGISVYHKFDMKAQVFDYTSGFILPDTVAEVPDTLSSWSLPASQALAIEHVGSYANLGNAWSAGHKFVHHKKLKQSKAGCYEVYRNRPEEVPPAEMKAEIFLPLR